ncbi:tRNA sulfurtransferase [Acrasis kona]|uniref:tRNA sulfurtransferase n=1 Tax=Acrasis kona TaxID=1008807 RepID=A0AAW2YW36_9EUKA
MPQPTVYIREVTPTVHILSTQFKRFGIIPLGGRCTIFKLRDGGLVAISPINLECGGSSDALNYVKNTLGGDLRLIVAPDLAHWMYLSQWKKEFPNAKIIGIEGQDAVCSNTVEFDDFFTKTTDCEEIARKYNVEGQISFVYFPGFVGKDVVVYHHESKSLAEADLIFNLPAKEQYGGVSPSTIMNKMHASSVWTQRFLWNFGVKDKIDTSVKAKKVAALDITRIIPCHGDVIEDGNVAWNFCFQRFLEM